MWSGPDAPWNVEALSAGLAAIMALLAGHSLDTVQVHDILSRCVLTKADGDFLAHFHFSLCVALGPPSCG